MSTIILRDLPPKTFVGLDLISFNSSPHFQGIGHIPPGHHFLYTGTDASLSIRHGHWIHLDVADTLTGVWNIEDEALRVTGPAKISATSSTPGILDYAELRDASAKVKTDTPSNTTTTFGQPSWSHLVSHISDDLLSRLLDSGTADLAGSPQPPRQPWSLTSLSASQIDTEPIPGLSVSELTSAMHSPSTSELHLLPIDISRTFPASSTGRARTTHARDRSWYLAHLLDPLSKDRNIGAGQILGELQFCFVTTLVLANWSTLQGWRRILEVALTCQSALIEIPAFFVEVLRVLMAQVGVWDEVEGGLFETEITEGGGAWLRRLLRRFRSSVKEQGGNAEGIRELESELSGLESLLGERYGWDDMGEGTMLRRGLVQLEDGEQVELSLEGADEEDELGDWAPMVVNLDKYEDGQGQNEI